MVSVFSEDLRILNAQNFKKDVSQDGDTKVYFTFGKIDPWANDSAPQQANTSVTSLNEVWNNMIGAKLLTGNEISHVIPRNNWTANFEYHAYDHCECSLLLFNPNTKFYIVTTDWNVYKCIANNYNGAPSTVMPTQILTDRAVEETDGYVWKYMYTITDAERLKYVTNNHMPVKTLVANDGSLQWQVQNNAVSGTIDSIKVVDGGSGYCNASNIIITITGDGTGATAIARINSQSNMISNIAMTLTGTGYTYAIATVSGGGGLGATLRPIISPTGGHGSDPLRELGGSSLMLNPRIQGSESGRFPVTNEFRQISLIQDPYVLSTKNVSTNSVVSQYTTILLSTEGSSSYIQDEIVYQGASLSASTFKARVLNYSNNYLYLINTEGVPQVLPIIGTVSGANRIPSGNTSIIPPSLQKYTGELLYIDNVTPISRAEDQTEDFKILLRF
jgi:hypothetical protein